MKTIISKYLYGLSIAIVLNILSISFLVRSDDKSLVLIATIFSINFLIVLLLSDMLIDIYEAIVDDSYNLIHEKIRKYAISIKIIQSSEDDILMLPFSFKDSVYILAIVQSYYTFNSETNKPIPDLLPHSNYLIYDCTSQKIINKDEELFKIVINKLPLQEHLDLTEDSTSYNKMRLLRLKLRQCINTVYKSLQLPNDYDKTLNKLKRDSSSQMKVILETLAGFSK